MFISLQEVRKYKSCGVFISFVLIFEHCYFDNNCWLSGKIRPYMSTKKFLNDNVSPRIQALENMYILYIRDANHFNILSGRGVGSLWGDKALEGQAIVCEQWFAPPMLCLFRTFWCLCFQGGLVWEWSESGRFLSNVYNSMGVASPKIREALKFVQRFTQISYNFQGASLIIREAPWKLYDIGISVTISTYVRVSETALRKFGCSSLCDVTWLLQEIEWSLRNIHTCHDILLVYFVLVHLPLS